METERIAFSRREGDRLRARLKATDCQVRRMLQRIRERGDGASGCPGEPGVAAEMDDHGFVASARSAWKPCMCGAGA